jgi:hypothetical protein
VWQGRHFGGVEGAASCQGLLYCCDVAVLMKQVLLCCLYMVADVTAAAER